MHTTLENNTTSKNKLLLVGKIINLPKYRLSPSGLETAHFKLWHESTQEQGYGKLDLQRKVEFAISVTVANNDLIKKLKEFTANKLDVNKIRIKIHGYLASRVFSRGEQQLVLHAHDIVLLNKGENNE